LNEHKDWLKAHFAEDRGWQEFLAKGKPPAPAPPATPSAAFYGAPPATQWDPYADPLVKPSAGADAIPRVKAPTPPDRGPQVPEPAVAPQAPSSRVPEPIEAPEAQAANPPPEFRPLETSGPRSEAAIAKQCLPAVLKLLAAEHEGQGGCRPVSGMMVSSAATSAPALAEAAGMIPTRRVREEA